MRLTILSLATAALTLGTLPALAGPDVKTPDAPSAAQNGNDPAFFMPADPHLSLLDQSRLAAYVPPNTPLDNLGFRKVASLENTLLHPFDKATKARLIKESLAGAI